MIIGKLLVLALVGGIGGDGEQGSRAGVTLALRPGADDQLGEIAVCGGRCLSCASGLVRATECR